MTNRIIALTVLLEKPIRDDDVQELINAIHMLRGVMDVRMHVENTEATWAYERARSDICEKLMVVMNARD